VGEIMEENKQKTKKELYDELKAKRMAEREAREKELAKKNKPAKPYQNPVKSKAGQILIWILIVAMVITFILSLCYYLFWR
jgi:flagellar basal body-associated protein FliL